MEFKVDASLIGEKKTDEALQISYNPPINWVENDSVFKKIETVFNQNKDNYSIKLKNLFWNKSSQSIMTVSSFDDISPEKFNYILQNYKTVFNSKNQWSNIKKGEYFYKKYWINQFLLQNKDLITFKLIIQKETKEIFEVNYIIPSKQYQKFMKNIESSIGSFSSNQ